jgi:flagellar hook-associated protein 2
MATFSTSAASNSSVASLTAPPTFTGVSKFASGLQQVLTRAIGIASLPLDMDQAQLNTLNTTQSDLQGLDTVFTSLQQSISSLDSAVSSGLLAASTSDSNVSATVGSGATVGTYTVAVDTLGAYSTALSNPGSTPVTNPTTQGLSADTSLTLSLGTTTIPITAASTSLQDLVTAINSQAGGQVQATLVNLGSMAAPDYRLSLQSAALTTDTIGLTGSSNNSLIQTSTPGTPASYHVDGSAAITSGSRTVTLSPGLTVNLLAQSASGASTTVTVSDSPASLVSAFSSFAGAYNAAVDAMTQYHGQNGGALEGSSIVQSLTRALNQLGLWNNGSVAGSLANYGITLDQTGHLSVNAAAFNSAANTNFSGLLTVLGSSTTGGFVQAATDLLNGVEDPTTGILKTEEKSIASQITTQQTTLNNEQARVTQMQTSLTQQIAQADSMIAQLESQVSYVTGLFAQFTGATNTQSNGLAVL